MKKNLSKLLAVLLALPLILSATAALASNPACPVCHSSANVYEGVGSAAGWYWCSACDKDFQLDSGSSEPSTQEEPSQEPAFSSAKGYISIPKSGEGKGEITFVSTRKCVVVLNGVKEYFGFRIEDGKLILTNAEGVETEVVVGEDGKGALELTLSNGETFTTSFGSKTLSYIINNGVLPIEKQPAADEGGAVEEGGWK